jgi:hypothetical protein
MRIVRSIAFLLLVLALPLLVSAQPGARRPSPSPTPTPPVISAQFVFCAAGDTACETANRVRQDVDRPMVNGQENVSITSSGEFRIAVGNRSIMYDLRDRVHTGNPQPAWTSAPRLVKPGFVSPGVYSAKTLSGCSSEPTCEYNHVTTLNGGGFTIDRIYYRLQWNPDSILQYINWVEDTSYVNVNYRKDATGETYTITPIATFLGGPYLAGLQGEKGNNITFAGQYNLPFTLVVTVR